MSYREDIPAAMKRALRQEAYFGCVICGNPIIEYHHIIPYCEVKTHEKDNLVVLCPTHHHRANMGEIYKEMVIQKKNDPFNKIKNDTKYDFLLREFKDLIVKAGGNLFREQKKILGCDGQPLITVDEDNCGNALLNVYFFDENNKKIAQITNNEWCVYDIEDLWDVKYSPGHLIIQKRERKILLELKVKENIVELRADMYFNGKLISIKPDKIIV